MPRAKSTQTTYVARKSFTLFGVGYRPGDPIPDGTVERHTRPEGLVRAGFVVRRDGTDPTSVRVARAARAVAPPAPTKAPAKAVRTPATKAPVRKQAQRARRGG